MALIKCPNCGSSISEHAKVCPQCGAPSITSDKLTSKPKRSKTWLYIGLVAIILMVAGAVVFFLPKNGEGETILSTVVTSDNTDDTDAIVEITPEFIEKVNGFDNFDTYSEGRAAVEKDGRWGYINTKGDLVIPTIYCSAKPFKDDVAIVETLDSIIYINRMGEKYFSVRNSEVISDFVNGYAVKYNAPAVGNDYVVEGNLHLINRKGETIKEFPIPTEASLIDYYEGISRLYCIMSETGKGFLIPSNEGNGYIFCDFEGNLSEVTDTRMHYNMENKKTDAEYDYVVFSEKIDTGREFDNEQNYGIKNKNGEVIVQAKAWYFPYSELPKQSGGTWWCRLVNPSNGVFYATLSEDALYLDNVNPPKDSEESTVYYGGFVDLKGNNTFSAERWARQETQLRNKIRGIYYSNNE